MKRTIIKLSPADDYGVYFAGWRNDYGTPLAFRGSLAEAVKVSMPPAVRKLLDR